MSVQKMEYKGQMILFTDYRGLAKPEQQLQLLEELAQVLKKSTMKVSILANFEGISLGTEYMNRVKSLGKEYQSKIKRQALLGITGLKNILLQGYITFTGAKEIKTFNTEAEAKDWLAG